MDVIPYETGNLNNLYSLLLNICFPFFTHKIVVVNNCDLLVTSYGVAKSPAKNPHN